MARTPTTFTTVRSEGGLLPPDLLQRIVETDTELGGFKPADYGLDERDPLRETISRTWQRARAFWAAFQAATEELSPDESGVTETREQWIRPLLRQLGYDLEFQQRALEVGDRRFAISHLADGVPVHVVSFRQDVDQALPGAGGRRHSPHALTQEYLNRAAGSLYGLVTNGLILRLLRDNHSLTRLSYLEFDLKAMLEGGIYADFVLLYLALHCSRLPRATRKSEAESPAACWLETWRDRAETQGARAMGELRKGVEQALAALGTGFLAHPANERLRERLRSGELAARDFYAQLLRLLYRLLFLFVAEERDLLFAPDASDAAKQRYSRWYSLSRLRDLTRRYAEDDRHDDLWRGLTLVFDILAGRREGLSLPNLAGGFFDPEACPDLDAGPALVSNAALAHAIAYLSSVQVARRWRRVNYRDIDTEELGGVYEGLLERQPRVTSDPDNPRFELVGSGTRKQTGSYYTPSSLVQELIRSTLDPVIGDRLAGARTPEQREAALLGIAVCDTSCGSGHFLLAAARRIADELARVRAGDREPSPPQLRQALRDVIRSCIYGVDLNPLAVDLCKLGLWLEGHDAGRPLTFLDHRIKLGNSLVGATPELVAEGIPDGAFDPIAGDDRQRANEVKRRNRQERAGQLGLFQSSGAGWATLRQRLATESAEIGALPEDAPRQVAEIRERYEAFERDRIEPARALLDAWTAAFFWPLPQTGGLEPPTTEALRVGAGEPPRLSEAQWREVQRLRAEGQFFHWPLEFPEVFARGGFDCVLGNPPWERIKLQEQEFFAERDEAIAKAPNKAARQRLIDALPRTNPTLAEAFASALRRAEGSSLFARASARFPLTAIGDVNLYALFAEQKRAVLNGRGRAGIIVPTGIATDDSTKRFFQDLVESGGLRELTGFENEELIFPGVHHVYKFCLLTIGGGSAQAASLVFFCRRVEQARDECRRFELASNDFALLNPNTRTCPIFRTSADADLTRAVYHRVPVLVDEGSDVSPWGADFLAMLHMANDSHLFRDSPGANNLPLYEAKLFHQFDHRYATYEGATQQQLNVAILPRMAPDQKADPTAVVQPRYWVPVLEVQARLAGSWDRRWLIAYRRIARATDERTLIATALPLVGTGDPAMVLLPGPDHHPRLISALLANLNALIFDYTVRQKLGGTDVRNHYFKQFPVLPPSVYTPVDVDCIVPRVLELTYTARDLEPFARDLGYDGPPFTWDEDRRALLRAELDAYYAALYGLTRDELRYILDPQDVYGPDFPGETFRVLKQNEIRRYGEYRTRRLALEAWERLHLEPRNRDGRYEVEPAPRGASAPTTPTPIEPAAATRGTPGRRTAISSPVARGRIEQPNGPSTPRRAAPAAEVRPVQPLLFTGELSGEAALRQRVLKLCLDTLRGSGPLTGRGLASRLAWLDDRIDKGFVNSVLCREGATDVDRDDATGCYTLKRAGDGGGR